MKRLMVLLLSILSATLVSAADLELRVLSYPKEIPQGAPIWVTVEIRNVSGHPITACGTGPIPLPYGLTVRRADGEARQGCPPPMEGKKVQMYGTSELPTNWNAIRAEDFTCRDEPGDLLLEFTLSVAGPCLKGNPKEGVAGEYQAWTGSAEAQSVRISVVVPKGVDLEAYRFFRGSPMAEPSKLLERFPSSTYAAYVVYGELKSTIPGASSGKTAVVGEQARQYADLLINPKKHPNAEDHRPSNDYLKARADKIEQVLKSHPDFPFRAGLYFALGLDRLELGHFPQATSDLNKCQQENPTPQVKETASIYLDVLEAYGWK